MSRVVSFIVLVGVIAVIGFLFYRVISGFLLPMFLAALLVVIFQPWHRWIVMKLKGRVRLAALATTASAVLVVLGPASLIIGLTIWELKSVGTTRVTGSAPSSASGSEAASGTQGAHITLQNSFGALRQSLQQLAGTQPKRDMHGNPVMAPDGKQMEEPRVRLDADFFPEMRYIESSLSSLQHEASAGATYDGDTEALTNLISAFRELEDAIRESEHEQDAADFIELLSSVKSTFDVALRDADAAPGSFRYQILLNDAHEQFQAFKVAVFGTTFNVWLAELLHPTDEEVRSLTGQLSAVAPGFLRSVGGRTGTLLGNALLTVAVTVIALYFFLADGPKMVRTVMRLSPLDDTHERELVTEFDRISRAVVLATLLSAVAQGLLAGVAFWLISLSLEEFNFVFSLTLLTTVLALIPFVGAAAVWAPVSLWLFFHVSPDGSSHQLAAIMLAAYGAGIVSMADNVIKPLVLHGQSNLHPLLALLSVLGGVQALGPIGILVGPMVVVFLQTLLNILHGELMAMEEQVYTSRPKQTLPFIFSLRKRRS